jgi:hypothetical protein
MNDGLSEQLPRKDQQDLEVFANRIASFPLLREYVTVSSFRHVEYNEEDMYRVATALIETWEEIGIENAAELIQKALDPIFDEAQSPHRFAQAIKRYDPLWREHVPYMILSAEEFLVRSRDPLEIKRIMAGGFSHDIWYYYLNTLDRRYTDKDIMKAISEMSDDEPDFDVEAEIIRQAEENQPELAPEVDEAFELVESGTYPPDIGKRDVKFITAYQNALKSKANQVIGSDDIDYLMRKRNMNFEDAFGSVVERARLIVKSGQYLLQLNHNFANLFN